MKNWKHYNLAIISVIFVFAFTFIGCDNGNTSNGEPEPVTIEDFFGTWVLSNTLSITFSENEIVCHFLTDGAEYTVSSVLWTESINTNSQTKGNYPTGYKITGVISASTDSSREIGDLHGDVTSHFLHKNKKSFIEQHDSNSWYDVYTKQNP